MTREQADKLIRARLHPNIPDGPFDVTEVMRNAAIDALIAAVEQARREWQELLAYDRQEYRRETERIAREEMMDHLEAFPANTEDETLALGRIWAWMMNALPTED